LPDGQNARDGGRVSLARFLPEPQGEGEVGHGRGQVGRGRRTCPRAHGTRGGDARFGGDGRGKEAGSVTWCRPPPATRKAAWDGGKEAGKVGRGKSGVGTILAAPPRTRPNTAFKAEHDGKGRRDAGQRAVGRLRRPKWAKAYHNCKRRAKGKRRGRQTERPRPMRAVGL
jgi:hypothetical protein